MPITLELGRREEAASIALKLVRKERQAQTKGARGVVVLEGTGGPVTSLALEVKGCEA